MSASPTMTTLVTLCSEYRCGRTPLRTFTAALDYEADVPDNRFPWTKDALRTRADALIRLSLNVERGLETTETMRSAVESFKQWLRSSD